MKTGTAPFKNVYSCPRVCAVLTQSLTLAFAPTLLADSSAWTVTDIRDTGFSRENQLFAAMSPSGEVYSVSNTFYAPATPCPAATLTLGDPSTSSSCVTKLDASGHPLYVVRIGGGHVEALQLDSAGNMYILGLAGPAGAGFATTPGAYESKPPGAPDPFVCKLSTNDGHTIFCTFIDVDAVASAFTVDSSGNAYIAGTCGGDVERICAEKLNSAGTALGYRTSFNNPPWASAAYVAVDAQGDLFITQWNGGMVKLDSSGAVAATSPGLGNDSPSGLALDPAGEPQVILADTTNYANMRLRRYSTDLATVLFETPLVISYLTSGGALLMGVDSAGVTTIVGGAYGVNLTPVHPTQTCFQQPSGSFANAFLARVDVNGNLLQFTYLGIPANFPEAPIVFQSGHASLVYFTMTQFSAGNWAILSLGPASSEVTLTCIGDGATFTSSALSPNEIVSLFGAGIGPVHPVVAQPDARRVYPLQLGGTQVTFDGVAAPLVYVSANQINLVTPRALQGKTTTHVCASLNSAPTNCLDVLVQPVTPEIFLSSGLYAAALNQDGTINSAANPAPVGSIVSVFATGLGAISALPDGAVTPWPPSQYPGVQMQATAYLSVSTEVTSPVNVLYAGPAPLEIEGLAQINFVIPAINFTGFPGRTVRYALQVPSPGGGASNFTFSNGVEIWTK